MQISTSATAEHSIPASSIAEYISPIHRTTSYTSPTHDIAAATATDELADQDPETEESSLENSQL
jgi:hypothetical protein